MSIDKYIFEHFKTGAKINCPCGKSMKTTSYSGHCVSQQHIKHIKEVEEKLSNGKCTLDSIYNIMDINIKPYFRGDLIKLFRQHGTIESLINSISKCPFEKGHLFESIIDIINVCGYIFVGHKCEHYTAQLRKDQLNKISNIEHHLISTKINNSNSCGASDITFKCNDTYYFGSVKYFANDCNVNGDFAENYGLKSLDSEINVNLYKNHIKILFVNDYAVVKNKLDMSHYKHKQNVMVIGLYQLNNCYSQLVGYFNTKNITIDNINSYISCEKEAFRNRLHQHLFTNKFIRLHSEGRRWFLYAWKPRSGKTYGIGDVIIKYRDIKSICHTLIVTPAPNETISQFMDMFNTYYEFGNFNVIDVKSGVEFININSKIISTKSNIIIVSKQLIDGFLDEHKIQLSINFDLFVFDEGHWSGTTPISSRIIHTYCTDNTAKIFLTATYNKPLLRYNIEKEACFKWSMEDEQMCKKREIEKLCDRHGSEFNEVLLEHNLEEYDIMPNLHVMTYMFHEDKYRKIQSDIGDSSYGFSLKTLMSLENQKFKYRAEVKRLLELITGSNRVVDYSDGDKSFYGRIKTHSLKNGSRTFNGEFTTQLWFLPYGIGMKIDDVSMQMKEVMMENPILKNYGILILNSRNETSKYDLKQLIKREENLAKDAGKDGLIVLLGMKCILGITLDKVDIVMLFTGIESSDIIMQMLYRCMTESKEGTKKFGYVIDLELSRTMDTLLYYVTEENISNGSVKKQIEYVIENNLINIDTDMLSTKITKNDIINKLVEIWNANANHTIDKFLSVMQNELVNFDNLIKDENFKTWCNVIDLDKYVNETSKKTKHHMDKEVNQKLPNGTSVKSTSSTSTSSSTDDIPKEEKVIQLMKISTPDLIKMVVLLTTFLNIIDGLQYDIHKLIEYITRQPELSKTLYDKMNIRFDVKTFNHSYMYLIHEIFKANAQLTRVANDTVLKVYSCIKPLINEPKRMIEFINSVMVPRKHETRNLGEVFTPLNIVDEMLNKLNDTYTTQYGHSIFINPNIKWFDPANGIGNFTIILYYKLMNGLKDLCSNIEIRKKYILENMIYVSELNPSNCYLYQLMIDPHGIYKMNIHCGDSLALKLNAFDVVMGNPPYNQTMTKAGAKPLYNKFIEYYMNKCKYMLFITPSRWFAGGKGLDKFRKMMLQRTDIRTIKQYDDASSIFSNAVEIKGGVNYFIIDKTYNGLCEYNGEYMLLGKYDIFVPSIYYSIIDKIIGCRMITSQYHGQNYYNIKTNCPNLIDDDTKVKCYVSKQKGSVKYIDVKYIKGNKDGWKVITARVSHKAKSGFGNTFVGKPNEVCSQSYILFDVRNEIEAYSLVSYLKCKFPNFMLSLRKMSQDINENTCKWIPLIPLDRIWTNDIIYEYFHFTDEEIELIKTTRVVGYVDS